VPEELIRDFGALLEENIDTELYCFAVLVTTATYELLSKFPSTVFVQEEHQVKLTFEENTLYILADPKHVRVSMSSTRMDRYYLSREGVSTAILHIVDALTLGPESYSHKPSAIVHASSDVMDLMPDLGPPRFASAEELKQFILESLTQARSK
jgi:hypothetical protein